jgi:class 3 adenylate cyclase
MDVMVEVRQPDKTPLLIVVREQVEMGRECDGLLLSDPRVSRRHAALAVDPHGLVVVDLGSTNGTTVNGAPATAPTRVGPADVVVLGSTEVRIVQPAFGPEPRTIPVDSGRTTESRGTVVAGSAEAAGAGEMVVAKPAVQDFDPRRTSIEMVADVVREELPAIAPSISSNVATSGGSEGTVTIVFSDIESSTEMASRLGDALWMQVLDAHNRIIRDEVSKFGGTEIKSQGDGFMLSFSSSRRGVMCTISIQQKITAYAEKYPDTGVRVRIGVHTGEAIRTDDGDLFGRHVIMAARIANEANGGQVLVSSLVREITKGGGDLPFGEPMPVLLKGLGDDMYDVFEIRWWDVDEE